MSLISGLSSQNGCKVVSDAGRMSINTTKLNGSSSLHLLTRIQVFLRAKGKKYLTSSLANGMVLN